MEVVTILQQVDLFRDLTIDQLHTIATITVEEVFNNSDMMFKQGDMADKMYIISQGQAEVIIEHSDGTHESVLYLGTGQIIGEMTLVDAGKRSATVRAAESPTRSYTIPNQAFSNLCEANTDIGYVIMRNIAQDMSFKLRHRGFDLKD